MRHTHNRPGRGRASRFKGVTQATGASRWRAAISLPNHLTLHLGVFDTELEAAQAYDEAALRLLGPGTFLNLRDLDRQTKPVIDGNSALIPTINGPHFRIDLEDLELVGSYYWGIQKGVLCGSRHGRRVQLHPLMLGEFPLTLVAVHLNGDPLDCRRDNMVLAPRCLQAGRNRKTKGCQSIYKGVRKYKNGTWGASIANTYLGGFSSEESAASAYDDAARKRFGIFAALNFPREGEISCHRDDTIPMPLAA